MRKRSLIFSVVVLLGLISPTGSVFAQDSVKNETINTAAKLRIFVMDFSTNDRQYKVAANAFTDDFETEIIKKEKYNVLLRRGYTQLLQAQQIEREILGISELPDALKDSLEFKKADAVFFGRVVFDEGSGEFELTVRLQPLDVNKPTLKKGQLTFNKGIIDDNNTRKSIARDMVRQLFAKEAVELKEKQLNIIEGKLSTYRARVKEVIDVFEDKIDYLLIMNSTELKPHLEEIDRKRLAFNEIWNDLNSNKVKYTKDFSKHWGSDSRIALQYVYSETMEDFHPEFKSYINYLQTRINTHRLTDFRNKKKKKAATAELAQTIKRELLKIVDEDYYTDVDKKINAFLNALRAEIIEDVRQLN